MGGGPAGLEAARVLSSRGHHVTLFERQDKLGGAVNIAARVAWRGNLAAITRWLEHQARKQSAEIRLGVAATRQLILDEKPDLIVLATGGAAARGPMEGRELVITVRDVLEGSGAAPAEGAGRSSLARSEPAGRSILVFDDNGAESALSAAEFLAERGARIEFVTADAHPGVLLERTTRPTFLQRLYDKGAKFTPDTRLLGVRREGGELIASLENEYNGSRSERGVYQVVVEYGSLPDESLYLDLKPLSRNLGEWDLGAMARGGPQSIVHQPQAAFDLFRVGDAVTSRNIHAAILDSLRICKDA